MLLFGHSSDRRRSLKDRHTCDLVCARFCLVEAGEPERSELSCRPVNIWDNDRVFSDHAANIAI
jgi:hypothetical protein